MRMLISDEPVISFSYSSVPSMSVKTFAARSRSVVVASGFLAVLTASSISSKLLPDALGASGVYAKSVFIKAHFFGQPFRVLKVDRTLVDYYTRLSDFHAQFRAVGTNYNQVVKELRLHFSEKKAMALLYKLEQQTVELVKLSRQIVELSREMEAKWSQKSV